MQYGAYACRRYCHSLLMAAQCIYLVVFYQFMLIDIFYDKFSHEKMSSSEQVQLMTNNVRYKKRDGSLLMMSERLAWCPEGREHFDIAVNYADVKCEFAWRNSNKFVC